MRTMKKLSYILFFVFLLAFSVSAQSKIKIKVEVFAEKEDKINATSFVKRELRSLGDVEIVEDDGDSSTVLFFLKVSKIENQILSGKSDANIDFTDLRRILNKYGFDERIKSSHHIFTKAEIEEIINIQPIGSKAKAYQVKQLLDCIDQYQLTLGE